MRESPDHPRPASEDPLPRSWRGYLKGYCPLLLIPISIAAACSESPADPGGDPDPTVPGDARLGQAAFLESCGTCHASRDGFDLAFFAFPDTTIVRRAVAHVDTPTAHDIAAYIRTIRAPAMGRDFRIFQPGGERLSSDVEFALRLFGADAWPEEMGPGELAAIDPARVPVALDLPLWSEESSNLDWMPEVPISTALLDHAGEVGPARPHLESYYRTRRLDDLLRAAVALRVAERDPANPAAPCVLEPPGRLRSEACFEARRWLSSLVAQHMLREGIERPLHPALHGAWWDVGDAARRSRFTDRPIENAERNWAVWMWLGWAFAPDRHASVYLGNALLRLGLPRHATFHALRALVARGPRGLAPFRDVRNAARFAPPHWAFAATRFGYQHLIRRLEAGSRPPGAAIGEAREDVLAAYAAAARKAPAGRLAELAALRDRVLAYLD